MGAARALIFSLRALSAFVTIGEHAVAGEVAEWLNAAVSKIVLQVFPVTWVRIPPSPPECLNILT